DGGDQRLRRGRVCPGEPDRTVFSASRRSWIAGVIIVDGGVLWRRLCGCPERAFTTAGTGEHGGKQASGTLATPNNQVFSVSCVDYSGSGFSGRFAGRVGPSVSVSFG